MTQPAFRRVLVLTGDHRLPDTTKRDNAYHEEDFETHRAMRAALESLPGYSFEFLDDHGCFLDRFRSDPPEFVLNFCDTGFRNVSFLELNIPAYLELLGVPYSGATPQAMVIAYDKALVRLAAQAAGVPVPAETYLRPDDSLHLLPDRYPALIKPSHADGSVGITKDAVVRNRREALAYIAFLRDLLPDRAALVQEYLPGPEYGMGLVGNPGTGLFALPPLEVDFSALPAGLAPILSFESKTEPDSPYWTDIRFRKADLADEEREAMEAHARTMFSRIGLKDYGRFDFRRGADGVIKLMEVNPNPAWANDGKFAFMAGFAGHDYPAMLNLILEAAQARLADGC
ncbi:MAG: D-alanine--D-alanine ligase [Proteobacteria bacterium]|nr:D-alanine--D-alanine ligase [Pseudomonadota bacterium]